MIRIALTMILGGGLAAAAAVDSHSTDADALLVSPEGFPLVVHQAAAALPPVRGALACQKCDGCGVSRHWATWFDPDGDWQPRPPHTPRSHKCTDPDGINSCENVHMSGCDNHQHEDGADLAGLVSSLVTAGPSQLAAMVAADPAVSLTRDGTALQVRSACNEGAIVAHFPLTAIGQ